MTVSKILTILFSFVFVWIGLQRSKEAIKKTKQRHQGRGIAFLPAELEGSSISRFFDLAFVLFCSALYSLLLIDSFVIQLLENSGFVVFLIALLITSITTIFNLCSWYIGKDKLGIGVGAIVTLSHLSIDDNRRILLWLPILVLVFMAITMWIYEFGFPFNKYFSLRQKNTTFLVIFYVVTISTILLGNQWVINTATNEKTPTIFVGGYKPENVSVGENKTFINNSFKKSSVSSAEFRGINSQRLLYAVLSDIHLNDDYKQNYFEILNERHLSKLEEQDKEELYRFETYYEQEERILPQQKQSKLDSILSQFSKLNLEDQANFLKNRLLWIHPVGQPNKSGSSIPLPAIGSEARLIQLSSARICRALSEIGETSGREVENLIRYQDYPDDSIPFDYRDEIPRAQEIFKTPSQCPLDSKIFPEIDNSLVFKDLLLQQLSLPLEQESYVAFKEYLLIAQAQEDVDDKSKKFIRKVERDLEPYALEALIDYFKGESGYENYEVFKENLLDEKIDFSKNKYEKFPDGKIVIRTNKVEGSAESPNKLESNGDEEKVDSSNSSARSESDSRPSEEIYIKSYNGLSLLKNILENKENSIRTNQKKCEPPDNDIVHVFEYCLKDEAKKRVLELFNQEKVNLPIYWLFDDKLANLFKKYFPSNEIDRTKVFGILNDPIYESFKIIETKIGDQDFKEAILKFNSDTYNPTGRENLLHDIAFLLYSSGGKYSHDILSRSLIIANIINPRFGHFIAYLFNSLIPFIGVLLAGYVSQVLLMRDKLGKTLAKENYHQARGRYELGRTDIVRGRNPLILEMKKLAGRGWSSIAIVGRRGIGKTRILYELMKADMGNSHPTTITAWVSAPTKFEESEFVESVLESLTTDIENAISEKLGVKPLDVRRTETNQTIVGILVYIICFIILFVIARYFVIRSSVNTTYEEIISTSLLVGFLMACSLACLIFHYIRLQPVNLSSWLERDRSSNPQTAILYREMRRVRNFLDNRRVLLGGRNKAENVNYPKLIIVGFLVITISQAIANFLFVFYFTVTFSNTSVFNSTQVFLASFVGILLTIVLVLALSREVIKARGYTLMSLVSEYREFVTKVVYRIRKGALGDRQENDFEVIVCIDELDKIVDESELRNFIRRIKVIFEIPGVYYYLSLSEDALKSFYLGTAEGKNEIDSAFDHVMYIPPVDCDLGEKIAKSYLDQHTSFDRQPGIERIIAAISYGVPRDILRRCDELIAMGNLANIHPSSVANNLRIKLAKLAYGEERLTKKASQSLSSNQLYSVLEEVGKFMDENTHEAKTIRVVLAIWLLALLSLATDSIDEQWLQTSERLRDIGYRVSEEDIDSLIDELKAIEQDVRLP